METKIKILDESVANIIAAGEVVENPAALIKELIENSLDAGATKIAVFIEKNGRNIKIQDNGCGMGKMDIAMCIERHATSKISKKEDIFNLSTYGFRGEALASIAAVSKLTISSRSPELDYGHSMSVYGGQIREIKEAGINRGTEIEVKDLFFNTPARLKFMKSSNTEYGKVKDIILKEALINYNVSISLDIDQKNQIKTTGRGWENTIMELFGKNVLKNLIPFEFGYLGKIELLKSSKDFIYTYFNKRYAKSQMIERAVIDAYYTKAVKEKYPFAILNIEINPSEIDVNVHPSKKIIKFSDDRKIYEMVKNSITKVFDKKDENFMPELFEKEEVSKQERVVFEQEEKVSGQKAMFQINEAPVKYEERNAKERDTAIENTVDTVQIFSKEKNALSSAESSEIIRTENRKAETKIIGQLDSMYILAEGEEGLEIYDQHIVHERILYEELKRKLEENKITSKGLLVPIRVELSKREREIIIENSEELLKMGFEIEEFGDEEILVRAVPDFEMKEGVHEFFIRFISEINEGGFSGKDIREKIIVSMSCKGAVKAGETLTMDEMRRLVARLHEVGKYTCPHGRPIIIKFRYEELEKLFKRRN